MEKIDRSTEGLAGKEKDLQWVICKAKEGERDLYWLARQRD